MSWRFQSALACDIACKAIAVGPAQVIRRWVRVIARGVLYAIIGSAFLIPAPTAPTIIKAVVGEGLAHARSHACSRTTKEAKRVPSVAVRLDVAVARKISCRGNATTANPRLQPERIDQA